MPPSAERSLRLTWVLLASILATLLASGCGELLAPLEDPSASLPQAPIADNASLVRIATCWEALPLAQALSQAYAIESAQISFDIVPGSSRSAISLVEAGQADLALVAEPGGAPSRVSGPSSQVIALDAVVIVVNAANGLGDISRGEAAALFDGRRLDWAELGDYSGRPELVSRISGAVGRATFEAGVMDQGSVSSAAIVMPHDRAIVDYVAKHPHAVGHLSRAYLDRRVNALALDGVKASPDAILSGEYPLTLRIRATVSEDASGEITRFLSFASGPRGQAVAALRYVPVR